MYKANLVLLFIYNAMTLKFARKFSDVTVRLKTKNIIFFNVLKLLQTLFIVVRLYYASNCYLLNIFLTSK